MLYNASEYFVKALANFKEGNERLLRLPGCDLDVFQVFCHWLINKTLPAFAGEITATHTSSGQETLAAQFTVLLSKVWVFADACLIRGFQNEAMHALLQVMKASCFGADYVHDALLVAPQDSLLRQALVRHMTFAWARGSLDKNDYGKLEDIKGLFGEFTEDTMRVNPLNDDDWKEEYYEHYMVEED